MVASGKRAPAKESGGFGEEGKEGRYPDARGTNTKGKWREGDRFTKVVGQYRPSNTKG